MTLTVKNLIEKLKQFDDDLPVEVSIFSKDRDRHTDISVSCGELLFRIENEDDYISLDVFSSDYFEDEHNYLED